MLTFWKNVLENSPDAYEKAVRARDAQIGAFLEFDPKRYLGDSRLESRVQDQHAVLAGLPFGVKDNIAVDRFRLSCGSRILEKFTSPYSATAVQRLVQAGAVPVGKTNLDEFGMGSSTDNSALGSTTNPWNADYVVGGSSGGSAAAVAAGLVPFALGSDTGGSVRQPASFCGVYGLKPTYGTVSRFGLVAYASSLDVVGALSSDIDVLQAVYEVMSGADAFDQTSMDPEPLGRSNADASAAAVLGYRGKTPCLGVLKPDQLELTAEVSESYQTCLEGFRSLGYEIKEVSLSMLEYVAPVYYTIATAEASANLARYNGVRYGLRPDFAENPDELVRLSRDEGFGPEVKLRILLGTYVLRSGFQDQYYLRAQKIRTAIRRDFEACFGEVDMILTPTFPRQAFRHGGEDMSPFEQKQADKFTASANLAGVPALSFPAGVRQGLPVGMQLVAPAFGEARVLAAARDYATLYQPEFAPGYERPAGEQ